MPQVFKADADTLECRAIFAILFDDVPFRSRLRGRCDHRRKIDRAVAEFSAFRFFARFRFILKMDALQPPFEFG